MASFASPALVVLTCLAASWLAACAGSDATGSSHVAGLSSGGSSQTRSAGTSAEAAGQENAPASPRQLVVFAASSLRDAFKAIADRYASSHPDIQVVLSVGASSVLRAQLEQGAPADVFASADTKNPQVLAGDGLTDGGPVAFATNRLAIIVPADNPVAIRTAYDLARPGVRIVGAASGVPIATYADRLIENLQADRGAPAGFADAVNRNIISREENVGAVVAKVELGEADAAIVYATDARTSKRITEVPLPDRDNVLASYGAVVLRSSASLEAARTFLAWLTGPEGQSVLAGFGFRPPARSPAPS